MKTKATPITTQPLQREQFHNTLGQHLIKKEGPSLRIHTDDGGIPTLGPGYALAVKTTNGLKLRPLSDMEEAVQRGTGNPDFRFDVEELDRLQKTVDAVNGGQKEAAKKLIPPVGNKEAWDKRLEQSNNHFSFTLDKKRRLDVIKPEMEKAQEGAWRSVEQKAKEQGWNSEQTEAFKKQFFNSEEMVGLASLKFNMGANEPIPKTAEAIVTGDRARVIYEIETCSASRQPHRSLKIPMRVSVCRQPSTIWGAILMATALSQSRKTATSALRPRPPSSKCCPPPAMITSPASSAKILAFSTTTMMMSCSAESG
jgi:hypothetical protein